MTPTFDDEVYEDGQQHKDDAKLVAFFYMRPVKHEAESIKQGRPIFVEIEYIKIITPGQKDNLETEATETYRQRFPKQYAQFKARTEQAVSGTPLAELPWMSIGTVAEYNALNVKTVEQLVNLPDAVASKFMGFHQDKQRAERFLDAANGVAADAKLEKALEERDAQIESLRKQVEELIKNQEAKQAGQKPANTPTAKA